MSTHVRKNYVRKSLNGCLTWETYRRKHFAGICPILPRLKTYGWAVGQGPRNGRRQGAAPSNIFNFKAVLHIYCSISQQLRSACGRSPRPALRK